MAGRNQVPEDVRHAVKAELDAIAAETGRTSHERLATLFDGLSGETIRKARVELKLGRAVVEAVEAYRGKSIAELMGGAPARVVVPDERYHVVAVEFAKARAAGVSNGELEVARLELGVYKGEPTVDEVRAEIKKARRAVKEAEGFYDIELDRPPQPARKR